MISCRFDRNIVAARFTTQILLGGMIIAFCSPSRGSAQESKGIQQRTVTAESDVSIVFVNGEFIPSPYEIRHEDDCVFVNGHRLEIPEADLNQPAEREGRNGGFGRGGGPEDGRGVGRRGPRPAAGNSRTPSSPSLRFARGLREELENAGMLIAFDGYPVRIVPIDGEGLSHLLASGDFVTESQLAELNLTDSDDETAVWMNWLSGYEVSSELQSEIQAMIDRVVAFEAEFRSDIAQVARLEQYAYPLTVLGMLLGVVALGYMLQWAGHGLHQFESTAESERYVVIALCMMAGMAAVDFIWTVLAGQAGQMKEVNPLAANFIESPAQLAVFKILATGIGFGILYFWRQRQQIRQATWWMCLVSVLLTFRWVMFDSMRI